jgi:hypothetical protein
MIAIDKIVEIILGKAVDRLLAARAPRKRLAKGFLELFEALTNCHNTYLAYEAKYQGQKGLRIDEDEWHAAVLRLARSIEKLSSILQIQKPDLFIPISRYAYEELVSSQIPAHMTEDSAKLYLIVKHEADIFFPDKDNDLDQGDQNFEMIVSSLRSFMTTDLKLTPEELIDAKAWI